MIQFNLLPDVKLEFVKAQRTKRLVVGSAVVATATTFAIFALLCMVVYVVQKNNLSDLNSDIEQYSSELKATPDLNKILTIQGQLTAINGLHDQKPVASRVFSLVNQVTPADVTISDMKTNFTETSMTLSGQAPSLDKVNIYADTLKFVTYTDESDESHKAFSDVVLTQFSRDSDGATYTIDLKYAPALFDIKQQVSVVVPKTITTRSVLEQPTAIFKAADDVNDTESN